jgi:hypothetical protein
MFDRRHEIIVESLRQQTAFSSVCPNYTKTDFFTMEKINGYCGRRIVINFHDAALGREKGTC